MKGILSLLAVLSFGVSIAQSDPEAKKILDDLSAATSEAKNIEIYFTYTFENPEQNIPKSEEKGYLLLEGEKYFIQLLGIEQFCDGQKVYRVMHDDETVEMMSMDTEEGEMTPASILSMYQEGFKFRLMESEASGGDQIQWIRLYPENAAGVPYVHIDLAVNKSRMQMNKVIEQGKNGTITSYLIQSYKTDTEIPNNKFNYSEDRYPYYELIDLDF
jgi:outer membrane lipoprotein-sorting protein